MQIFLMILTRDIVCNEYIVAYVPYRLFPIHKLQDHTHNMLFALFQFAWNLSDVLPAEGVLYLQLPNASPFYSSFWILNSPRSSQDHTIWPTSLFHLRA